MANLIIHNANLRSFHEGFKAGGCDTIAIDDNRIKAIGRWNELKSLVQTGTQVIDAGGKTLMPGFNDSHIHIWKVGNLQTFMLDVRGAASLDEMLGIIRDYYLQHPEIAWITARGFNEAGWPEGRMPDKSDLDKIVKDKPVYLIRTCAHIAVANTRALELSGINANTPIPAGGVMYAGPDWVYR
jgi:predicted amidohydrolase YtcJ